MTKSSFVKRLEQRMIDLGLKQLQVEQAAGMSRGYLTRVLTGERVKIRLNTSQALADALGVRREWLFDGDGPMLPPGATPPATTTAQTEASRTTVELDWRYSNLAQAATALRGKVDDSIIDSFRYYDMKSDDDLPFDEWVRLILDRSRRVKKALSSASDSIDYDEGND